MTDCKRSETPEDIYENVNNKENFHPRTPEKKQQPQNTGRISVKNRKSRAACVCLCLLCVLLLTAVIVLCVCYTTERKHIHNLTEEREKMMNDKNQLHRWLNEHDRLADNLLIYHDFSFYYFSYERKSWSDSRRYCQQRGADLAVSTGQKQTEFFKKFVQNNSLWVGWRKTGGEWKWINDPTVANGFGADSSECAGLTAETYYSYACNSPRGWICKKTYT